MPFKVLPTSHSGRVELLNRALETAISDAADGRSNGPRSGRPARSVATTQTLHPRSASSGIAFAWVASEQRHWLASLRSQ